MEGELLIKGYKFDNDIRINFQSKTVIVGDDSFIVFEVFNMLEKYFNKKDFSEYYLNNNTTLVINELKLSGNEFIVFRMKPLCDLNEELKLTKKSFAGKYFNEEFSKFNYIEDLKKSLNSNILGNLNNNLKNYNIEYDIDELDFFDIAKLISPNVYNSDGDEILFNEQNQFFIKCFLLNFINQLKTEKKIMLLIELPEYGLNKSEITELFKVINELSIDNVIVYTNDKSIIDIIKNIFSYHSTYKNQLCGFDDYDLLEEEFMLKNNISRSSIEKMVLENLFKVPEGELIKEIKQFFDKSVSITCENVTPK